MPQSNRSKTKKFYKKIMLNSFRIIFINYNIYFNRFFFCFYDNKISEKIKTKKARKIA